MKAIEPTDALRTLESKIFYDRKYGKEDFKRHRFLDRVFIRSMMSKYKIPRTVWVLDVGCGTGWYSHLLAEHSLGVVGVDMSRTAVVSAKKRWKEENIHWIVGDACCLSFKNGFDAVFCSGFSPFNVSDMATCTSVARKLFGYLKPGGLFIFVESSNLSGMSTTVANHSLRQVRDFFANLKFVRSAEVYAANVQLFPFFKENALNSFFTKLTSVLQKIHNKSCRIICVCRKIETGGLVCDRWVEA